MKNSRWFKAILCCAAVFSSASVLAQAYPNKPIRLLVGWPPGGGADIVARVMADGLTANLQQQVVVENRPGASGNIGAEAAARSTPDGYTLLLVGGNHATNISLYPKLSYDPIKDFEPVSLLTAGANLLVVNPALPVRSFDELVAHVRARPGQLSYGSAGNGTTGHLAMELLKATIKMDMVHVPYKGGSPFMTDLIGGQVVLGFENILSASTHVRSGRLRAIATSGNRRSLLFPDVPTVAESGYPGFEVILWQGLLAPAGTPKDVIDRVNAAVLESLKRPVTLKRFQDLAVEPIGGTPAQFREFLTREIDKWSRVIKATGIRLG